MPQLTPRQESESHCNGKSRLIPDLLPARLRDGVCERGGPRGLHFIVGLLEYFSMKKSLLGTENIGEHGCISFGPYCKVMRLQGDHAGLGGVDRGHAFLCESHLNTGAWERVSFHSPNDGLHRACLGFSKCLTHLLSNY